MPQYEVTYMVPQQAFITANSPKEARAAIYARHPTTYDYPVSHSANIRAPAATKVLSVVEVSGGPETTSEMPPRPPRRKTTAKKAQPRPTPDPEVA